MQKITSRDNQKLKLARQAREGRSKNLIFIEGTRLAEEALRSRTRIAEAFFSESFLESDRGRQFFRSVENSEIPLNEVSDKIFNTLADTVNSQGIVLTCERPATSGAHFETVFDASAAKLPILIALHQINNPSNLGAILRTAEAVDVAGVIVSQNSADVFSPKSLRASMGAGLRLNVWENAGFAEMLRWAETRQMIPTAADINARKNYTEIDWRMPRLLIFGSEAHGLSAEERAEIDELLLIPMENEVESLNLAVSCGIVLFEAKRQHSQTPE